jgi:hypothetical protein
MDLISKIDGISEQVEYIKRYITTRIESLPDNPNIERVKDAPNCFVMSISQVIKHDNMSAQFHDFKHQYKNIIKYLEVQPLEKIIERLTTMIQDGYFIPVGCTSQGRVTLHPKVREDLSQLFKFNWEVKMRETLSKGVTFKEIFYLKVYLDKKLIGKIKELPNNRGYQYFPTGSKTGGEIFERLRDCKRSL